MECSSCGAANPEGKKFCGRCGTSLPVRCTACGVDNPPDNRFCADCGAALTVRASTTPAAASPLPAALMSVAERRQLTVMFCDLVGSTALASRLDPEDLREIIGAYHRCVAERVGRFDGFVANYKGDGVLYFGYPQAVERLINVLLAGGYAVGAVALAQLHQRGRQEEEDQALFGDASVQG
jgi:class 3 adenylate cyclase